MARPYPWIRWWLLPFARSRIWTVRGLDHLPTEGAFIVVANHQSWLDSPLLASALYRRLRRPLKFISQSGKWNFFGALPIRDNDRSQVVEVAVRCLEEGYPVAVFPEGNSNNAPELRVAKTGAARLALRTGLPVVPVGIRGTRGARPWKALVWFFSLVYPCYVEIGQPILFPKTELRENDDELLKKTTEEIMSHISALSGKPLPGEGPMLGRRGVWWFIMWRLYRPLVQWRIRISGSEHLPDHGPFMVAANHSSYFDAPALAMGIFHVTGLQPMFPTKATVASASRKIFGRGGLNALGMLPLDNSDKSKVLGPVIDHIHRGGVIGIFPEGTRNKPSINPKWETEMLKGKTGAARLEIATSVQIIPAAIEAPKGLSVLESVVKGLLPWKFIRIRFGPPVVFSNIPPTMERATKDDLERLTRQILTPIATMTGQAYKY